MIFQGKTLALEVHQTVRTQLGNNGYQDGNFADLIYVVVNDSAQAKSPFFDVKGVFKLSLFYFAKVKKIKMKYI